ncbi:hypothetical protein BP5796_02760 [Coleophoma crateriformis]|uniref:Glycosyltransferase family 32 protein n=1 Tax=Coleophoma crateriformis TaxID=565419 RepID=A0A3D8SZ57_9HELO|nr:hypothetical protein BP5796_02760 [Coleophoma crateriformis]
MFRRHPRHQPLWIAVILFSCSILLMTFYKRDELSCMRISHIEDDTRPQDPITNNGTVEEEAKIPRHIYQTWKNIAVPNTAHVNSWQQKNPDHEYTLLTDHTADNFLQRYYAHRSDILEIYHGLRQRILAADMLRYLIIYALGGVYTDIDTSCSRPINEWLLNERAQKDFNLVVGVEADVDWDPATLELAGFVDNIQFIQWTVMGKAGHDALNRTIEGIVTKVHNDAWARNSSISQLEHDQNGILATTGPWMYSRAVRSHIDQTLNRTVPNAEFHGLTEPKIFGDVLVLPVNAWAPDPPHSNSGSKRTSLLRHWKAGSWRTEFVAAQARKEQKVAMKIEADESKRLSEKQMEQIRLNRVEGPGEHAEERRKKEDERRVQLEKGRHRKQTLMMDRLRASKNSTVASESNNRDGTKTPEPKEASQQSDEHPQEKILQQDHDPAQQPQQLQQEPTIESGQQPEKPMIGDQRQEEKLWSPAEGLQEQEHKPVPAHKEEKSGEKQDEESTRSEEQQGQETKPVPANEGAKQRTTTELSQEGLQI